MNRVLPGILMAGCVLLLLFWGTSFLFWVVAVLAAALALHEFFRMTCPGLERPLFYGFSACCLLPLLAVCTGDATLLPVGLVASLLSLVILSLQAFGKTDQVFHILSCSVFAALYISTALSFLVLIRFLPQGTHALILLVAMIAGSDTGAYYAGRTFGRRKLFPRISPKKTVAGGVGGIFCGVVAAEAVNVLFPDPVNPWLLLITSILLIIVGIAGDLTESLIKRSVGVKDSGTLLFGHGGLLDRIDSLLLAGPVFYYLLHFGVLQ